MLIERFRVQIPVTANILYEMSAPPAPLASSAVFRKLIALCQWEDETARDSGGFSKSGLDLIQFGFGPPPTKKYTLDTGKRIKLVQPIVEYLDTPHDVAPLPNVCMCHWRGEGLAICLHKAETKKMKSLTLYTHGCHRAGLRD